MELCLIGIDLGRNVPAFPGSFTALVSKCLVPRFLVSKCLEIGAEVSQSVLMPKCLVAEVSDNMYAASLTGVRCV